MNSLSELEYYCNTDNPVGALLLTGEWGCGKTYLIDHDLREKLKDKCVIIRISLFGIPSIEELHKAVKWSWIHAKGGLFDKASGLERFKGFIEKAAGIIPNKAIKGAVESAISFNLFEFIKIQNYIEDKKVILVFDDLERSFLCIQEKLGAINEYCENQKFNVIIVADEEKLNRDTEYKDFKEKIVQRTIHYKPCYSRVTHSVISDVKNETYKTLLFDNESYIAALFAGQDPDGNSLDDHVTEVPRVFGRVYEREGIDVNERRKELQKSRPHNIRSLKTAIQDFERVYEVLQNKGLEDCHKWLFSFICFAMASKANLVHKSERFGSLFSNNDLEVLYPGFYDSHYLPEPLLQWLTDGIWNRDLLDEYIEQHFRSLSALSPKDQVRNSRIDYLEEDIARAGLFDILPDAYNGELSLNEYVFLIINSRLARYYGLITTDIDWDKVCQGIEKRIELSIQNGEKIELLKETIEDLEDFSIAERRAYQIIKKARDGSVVMFEANRRTYINEMRNGSGEPFINLSNLRFNCFDHEMADATIEAFKKASIPEKIHFPAYFVGIWGNYRNSFDLNQTSVDKSKESFEYLKGSLSKLEEEYRDFPFKKKFTQTFMNMLDQLIDDESED